MPQLAEKIEEVAGVDPRALPDSVLSSNAPAATKPCKTPDKPTYQPTCGSFQTRPASIAMTLAAAINSQFPTE